MDKIKRKIYSNSKATGKNAARSDRDESGRSDENKASNFARQRRQFARFSHAWPVVLRDAEQNELARSCTDNISNGGCLVTVSAEGKTVKAEMAPLSILKVELKIPRSTRNTYMLEKFETTARVTRVENHTGSSEASLPSADKRGMGLALQFTEPVELQLE